MTSLLLVVLVASCTFCAANCQTDVHYDRVPEPKWLFMEELCQLFCPPEGRVFCSWCAESDDTPTGDNSPITDEPSSTTSSTAMSITTPKTPSTSSTEVSGNSVVTSTTTTTTELTTTIGMSSVTSSAATTTIDTP
ncbi:unnamed protein product [Timema podura]|uniref:Uncharacterized protein n=1 Tax=Timema podura TaxID=61482 RepID=A0ABN7NP03_TIMPD|nr:unnamed protein product [Timema podura]